MYWTFSGSLVFPDEVTENFMSPDRILRVGTRNLPTCTLWRLNSNWRFREFRWTKRGLTTINPKWKIVSHSKVIYNKGDVQNYSAAVVQEKMKCVGNWKIHTYLYFNFLSVDFSERNSRAGEFHRYLCTSTKKKQLAIDAIRMGSTTETNKTPVSRQNKKQRPNI